VRARRLYQLLVATLLLAILVGGESAAASRSGIPASAKRALLNEALRVGKLDGDSHPYDIRAVRTTVAGAGRATHCHCRGFIPPPTTPVYLVAMRGHFACNNCSHPPGARIGPGTVITLESPVTDPGVSSGFGFSNRYPDLKLAGLPERL
jgi:hypothetical protein